MMNLFALATFSALIVGGVFRRFDFESFMRRQGVGRWRSCSFCCSPWQRNPHAEQMQSHPWTWLPWKSSQEQMRFSAFDCEMFACVAGISHFRYMLEGRPFTIYEVSSKTNAKVQIKTERFKIDS
jgi:hypothetical protein